MSTNNHVVLIPSFVTSSDDARNAAFGGWFTDSLMSNPAGTVTSITAARTLYGAFGTLRTITFAYGSSTVKSTQAEGEALVLPTYTESKAGYTFKWCTEDESVCKTSEATVPTQDITLKATLVPNEYTATFKNGYDESETTTKTIKCDETIKYPAFTRVGHSINRWSSDVTVTNDKMPASNVVFTAQWTVNNYNITFDYGNGTSTSTEFKYNETIIYPTSLTREGYTFVEWDPKPERMSAEDTTVVAQWSINNYNITFVNDGVVVNESTLEYGEEIIFPSEPVKEGYTFSGWIADVTVTDNKMPASNVVFTAQWAIKQYTITFNSNGGSACSSITKDCGAAISLPSSFKTGYTFIYWCGDSTLNAEYKATTMPAEDKMLYAKWRINSYNITFVNDGVVVNESTLEYGEDIIFPSEPVKEGYNFSGWVADVTVTGNKMPASNVVFTAQWTEVSVDDATNIVQIIFKTVNITKEEMIKEIKNSISAEEDTYKIKAITSDESEGAIFIVVFNDVEDAKNFVRNVK